MQKIVLISCASKKLTHNAKAKDMYVSSLFRGNIQFAISLNPDKIFILSAKYGLLNLDTTIEPYDKSLSSMPSYEAKDWANNVVTQLRKFVDLNNDEIIFLAGKKYRKYLIPHIAHYSVPLEGLTIGKQLKYLKNINSHK